MGFGAEKDIAGEEPGKKITPDERGEAIDQRLKELEERSGRTQNMEELAHEMIADAQQYSQLLHARIENTQQLSQLLHEPRGYPEGRQVIH